MSTTSSYGVTERAASSADADRHAEHVRVMGYTVVDGGFTLDEVRDFSGRLDALVDRQAAEAGSAERLARIGEREIVRCCLAFDDAFVRLVANERVTAVCSRLLGDYFVVMQQNGIVNPPQREHTQAAYHRDLPYQHFISSRPLAVSALFCIDPFTPDNGATYVIPASHRIEQFPSEAAVRELERPVSAPAGSFIVFDSMLFHRAGHNTSAAPRRAVNQVYSLPFIAQQFSLAAMTGNRFTGDPTLARLLGYGAGPVSSVEEWWTRRERKQS